MDGRTDGRADGCVGRGGTAPTHLSLGRNPLFVQFEGGADLPPHGGRLLTRVQGVLLGELPCQLLEEAGEEEDTTGRGGGGEEWFKSCPEDKGLSVAVCS